MRTLFTECRIDSIGLLHSFRVCLNVVLLAFFFCSDYSSFLFVSLLLLLLLFFPLCEFSEVVFYPFMGDMKTPPRRDEQETREKKKRNLYFAGQITT